MKVFGGTIDGKERLIVAASSKKKAAALLGVTSYYFEQYFTETGNVVEIEAALRAPETVLSAADHTYSSYVVASLKKGVPPEPPPLSAEALALLTAEEALRTGRHLLETLVVQFLGAGYDPPKNSKIVRVLDEMRAAEKQARDTFLGRKT